MKRNPTWNFFFRLATIIATTACCALASAKELPRLKVSENGRFFVKDNGQPFFYLGDTAWSIFNHPTLDEIDTYLDDRAGKGFTVIQGVLVLWDGLRRPNPDGELPFVDGDPGRINEAYFARADAILAKAEDRGLYMAILPFWVKGFIRNRERYADTMLDVGKMRDYCRFLGKRYGARPVIWVLGGDWPGRDTRELTAPMAQGLEEGAGTDEILISYHPTGRQSSSFWFQNSSWLDFNMIQSGHFIETTNFKLVADDYAKRPIKPTLDAEPGYENITDRLVRNDPGARRIKADDVRRSAYLAVFAGAAGHTYGNGEVYEFWSPGTQHRLPGWAAQLPWRDSLELPGSSQMQYLRRLIESRPMLLRIPDQSLIAGRVSDRATERIQATRGSDGSYAFVYTATGEPFTVNLEKLSGKRLRAYWYDPRDGTTVEAGEFARADARKFSPPSSKTKKDWVLVLDDASKGFPLPGAKAL